MKQGLFFFFLFITCALKAQITEQPNDTSICPGGNVFFKIKATGGPSYQWQMNSGSGWTNLSNGGSSPAYSGVTSNTLTLSSVGVGLGGYQFRCIVSSPDTSNSATLTLNTLSTIPSGISSTSNPVCNGQSTTLSFTGGSLGSNAIWKWYAGSCSGTNFGSGVSTIVAPTTSTTYFLRAEGLCNTTSCVSITINVNNLPAISSQPSNTTLCQGANTSFSVGATGSGLLYQWQYFNGSVWSNITSAGSNPTYSGFNSANLGVNSVSTSNNGLQYRCNVSGSCSPSVTSNSATLTVLASPTISSHPSNTTICEGGSTSFSIAASGVGLTYQWQVNTGSNYINILSSGSNPTYSGFNSSTLGINATVSGNNGYFYRCVVSGTCSPPQTSNAGSLTINLAPSLNSSPTSVAICEGNCTSFTVSASGTGLSYVWQFNNGSSWNTITSAGSNPVYSNFTSNTLGICTTTSGNSGYQYRCIVSGTCIPSVTSGSATLTVYALPAILSHPTNKTICEGSATSFGINASGSGLVYLWQVNSGSGWSDISSSGTGPVYSNWNTATLGLSKVLSWNNNYQYRCQLSGICTPTVTSNVATLSVNTIPGFTSQSNNVAVCENSNANYLISATGTNLSYQWQYNSGGGWNDINSAGTSTIFSNWNSPSLHIKNILSSYNNYQFRCNISNIGCSVSNSNATLMQVYSNPDVNAGSDLSICLGSKAQLQTIVSGSVGPYVYSWYPSIGLNNTAVPDPKAGPAVVTTYVVNVTDVNGCSMSDDIKVDVNQLPVADAGRDTSICFGDTAHLHGYGGTSYKWSPALSINNSGFSDPKVFPRFSQKYKLIVNDVNNCSDSDEVRVLVNSLPQVKAGPDIATCKGKSTQLNASGGVSYNWTPPNGLLNPNIINPVSSINTTTEYIVTGVDLQGCRMSDTVKVSILELPNVNGGTDVSICKGSSVSLNGTGAIDYKWMPAQGLDNNQFAKPIASPIENTRYILLGTDSNGCQNSDEVNVTVNNLPIADAGVNRSICLGSQIQLQGKGGIKYIWKPAFYINDTGIANPYVFPELNQDYELTVEDINGCKDQDSISIQVIVNPIPKINGDNLVCKNQFWSGYTTAISQNQLHWNPLNGIIQSGQYSNSVKVHWQNSDTVKRIILKEQMRFEPFCYSYDTFTVLTRTETAPEQTKVYVKANDIASGILISKSTNYEYYQWGYENKLNPIEQNTCKGKTWCYFNVLDTLNNYYWVYVANDSICMTKSYFNAPLATSSVTDMETVPGVNVYPNPSEGSFYIQCAVNINTIKIYNIQGQALDCNFVLDGKSCIADLSQYPSGIYLIQIGTKNGFQSVKLHKL